MKKKFLIAIVDKNYESQHSFIKNFLVENIKYFKVNLLCEKLEKTNYIKNQNYKILPILKRRENISRIYNFLKIYLYILKYKKLNPKNLNILVRNDPLSLLAVSLASDKNDNLIYQSSFPHELSSKIKGFFQYVIFFY